MSDYIINDTVLTGIANAIRSKTGNDSGMEISEMRDKIRSISSGPAAHVKASVLEVRNTSLKTFSADITASASLVED